VTLAASFSALPQITQPQCFIFLRLIHDDFLPNPFQFIADESTCLSNRTVHIAVQCTERCITHGAKKWITAKVIQEASTA